MQLPHLAFLRYITFYRSYNGLIRKIRTFVGLSSRLTSRRKTAPSDIVFLGALRSNTRSERSRTTSSPDCPQCLQQAFTEPPPRPLQELPRSGMEDGKKTTGLQSEQRAVQRYACLCRLPPLPLPKSLHL